VLAINLLRVTGGVYALERKLLLKGSIAVRGCFGITLTEEKG
jgi:hypothetical protein